MANEDQPAFDDSVPTPHGDFLGDAGVGHDVPGTDTPVESPIWYLDNLLSFPSIMAVNRLKCNILQLRLKQFVIYINLSRLRSPEFKLNDEHVYSAESPAPTVAVTPGSWGKYSFSPQYPDNQEGFSDDETMDKEVQQFYEEDPWIGESFGK